VDSGVFSTFILWPSL